MSLPLNDGAFCVFTVCFFTIILQCLVPDGLGRSELEEVDDVEVSVTESHVWLNPLLATMQTVTKMEKA